MKKEKPEMLKAQKDIVDLLTQYFEHKIRPISTQSAGKIINALNYLYDELEKGVETTGDVKVKDVI